MTHYFHNKLKKYRVTQLADAIAGIIPTGNILDIGSGDGELAHKIALIKNTEVTGCDIILRDRTAIPTIQFDGKILPFESGQFKTALLVDVLHHDKNPECILSEALRVAQTVVIKDHITTNALDSLLLKYMDNVGNKRYGIPLPNNYLSEDGWNSLFKQTNVHSMKKIAVKLYPLPISAIFSNRLQIIFKISSWNSQ